MRKVIILENKVIALQEKGHISRTCFCIVIEFDRLDHMHILAS